MTFREYIGSHYRDIKLLIKRNCWKHHMKFDEDIFQDTLMKCLDKDANDYNGYIINAYNKNLWRDALYNKDVIYDIPEQQSPPHSNELNNIYDVVEQKFGPNLTDLFKMWLKGYSVREIEELSNQTRLTYQFKKIRNYIRTIK